MQKWRQAYQADISHNIQLTCAPSLNTTLRTRGPVPAPQTLNLTGQCKQERCAMGGEVRFLTLGGLTCKLPAMLPQSLYVYSHGFLKENSEDLKKEQAQVFAL